MQRADGANSCLPVEIGLMYAVVFDRNVQFRGVVDVVC